MTHCTENIKEYRWKFFSHYCYRESENPERKNEAPPANIEWELAAAYTGNCEEEPDDCKTPHDEGSKPSRNIQDLPGSSIRSFKSVCLWKDLKRYFPQLHDGETALT